MSPPVLAALAAVVLVAFAVEAALGFGATIITVALGAFLLPLDVVLPAFVPVNVALSLYVAARYRRDVDRRLLLGRIAPLMGLGLPAGLYLFHRLGSSRLQVAFGIFVAVLSVLELSRPRDGAARPPGKITAGVLLIAAGVIHGAFATGGPLAVYVTGRELSDKARFRATLSALWLVLNVALVISYVAAGQIGGSSLSVSAVLVPPLLSGIALGEVAHRRVPEGVFRRLVFALLLGAGVLLAARAR